MAIAGSGGNIENNNNISNININGIGSVMAIIINISVNISQLI
jgi:hypothetical protein